MKHRADSASFGFTLIELLTVIAIIAILMGLLFPAVNAVKDNAKKVQAKNDVMQIVAAVKSYYTEYGKYPPLQAPGSGGGKGGGGGSEAETDQIIGDEAANAKENNSKLFNTLRAIAEEPNTDNKLNPRRVVFFEAKAASNPDSPRAGFLDRVGGKSGGDKGSFYDPWGKQYNIVLDSNYDNVLDVSQVYTDFSDTEKPRTAVGAFSLGKDNKIGENGDGRYRNGTKVSDDVISWQ
jgi:prepilin-type N-terminal cleavage/methylation domain-containing protein